MGESVQDVEAGRYTHAQLVNVARKWLANRRPDPCVVVVTELALHTSMESPDAIGFDSDGRSILVECKTSRADFRCDSKKMFRINPHMGMGLRRYYFTPPGLLAESELPEGWGLLERYGRGVRVVKESGLFEERNHAWEKEVLISSMRRLYRSGRDGVRVRCYSIDTNEFRPRATLGIMPAAPRGGGGGGRG